MIPWATTGGKSVGVFGVTGLVLYFYLEGIYDDDDDDEVVTLVVHTHTLPIHTHTRKTNCTQVVERYARIICHLFLLVPVYALFHGGLIMIVYDTICVTDPKNVSYRVGTVGCTMYITRGRRRFHFFFSLSEVQIEQKLAPDLALLCLA